MSNNTPGVSHYFGPEELAAAVHDCEGKRVVTDEGVAHGYGLKCQPVNDIQSKKCLAYKVAYTDPMKNEYWIGLDRRGSIYNPFGTTEPAGRTSMIMCNERQFNTYLNILRTGITFELKTLKDELKTR